jgi:hypothetical protein
LFGGSKNVAIFKETGKMLVLLEDEPVVPPTRAATPFGAALSQAVLKVAEIDKDLLRRNLTAALQGVEYIFGDFSSKSNNLEIDDITVSLTIGKSGEISLVSLTRGAISGATCISVRLRCKT